MLKAVVVDDETKAREALIAMLGLYCPSVKIVGQAWNVQSAFDLITQTQPDVVFLDIQMPDGIGFELLSRFQHVFFKFIIVTAYQEHAIRAFKFSAIDFILKPIDPTELEQAVEKLAETIKEQEQNLKLSAFASNIKDENRQSQKVLLKTNDSIEVVELGSIIRCESQNNYTLFFFNNRPKLLVSKTLKEFEVLLTGSGFLRTHQSHLVNVNYISNYIKQPDTHLILKDGTKIPVAVRKRETVDEVIGKI